jgi:hypothetical protein
MCGQVLSLLFASPTAANGPLPVEGQVSATGLDHSFDYTKSRRIERLQCQDIMTDIFQVRYEQALVMHIALVCTTESYGGIIGGY